MYPMQRSDEERLDALFQAYKHACAAPEPSANFMPELWQRIESRQSFTFSFRRMANAFVTAAVALSIALGVYTSVSTPGPAYYAQSYIDVLADANPIDTPEILAPAGTDTPDVGR
jgi:hypothetical protein